MDLPINLGDPVFRQTYLEVFPVVFIGSALWGAFDGVKALEDAYWLLIVCFILAAVWPFALFFGAIMALAYGLLLLSRLIQRLRSVKAPALPTEK